ncbi:predicted protein [Uncinocarpus reesii 1704]|uniref:DNA endonuclease activator Ctp1 C-terminal domain-containing protein n=1 Tax=Uncinocarpus reesii (strain UAMH 1704) TaxID=336963 RepID=C4JY36_UNCRE|nr:uncharacterized protein UREG_07087 [Uncinocarpus reesii 1704]EEP82222.1 predicted protein [Uncinocarpus reesii 1704]
MAEPTTPVKMPQPAGCPLVPISPERINQQRFSLSPTKSLDAMHSPSRSGRGASDVQAKVAFLNRLSSATTPERPASHVSTTTAALQRAILGREEAESALQSTLAQLSQANARERRVSERLEALVEELHALKERQVHERTVFEKEVRKARKEAFRAGSVLVKVQEELKYSRGQMKALKDEVKAEKEAKEKAKQEAFERAYALAGLTEEMEALKDKLRSSEAETHLGEFEQPQTEDAQAETPANRLAAPEPAVMSVSPESRGLKRGQPDSVDHRSPCRKRSLNSRDRLSANLGSPVKFSLDSSTQTGEAILEEADTTESTGLVERLNDDLRWEKRMRQRAEDMIHFLKMECQFRRCSCRLADNRGTRYIHDASWEQFCETAKQSTNRQNDVMEPTRSPPLQDQRQPSPNPTPPLDAHNEPEDDPDEPLVTFCPDTGTFQVIPSPNKATLDDHHVTENDASQSTLRCTSPTLGRSRNHPNAMRQEDHFTQLPENASQMFERESPLNFERNQSSSHFAQSATVPQNHTSAHNLSHETCRVTQPSHSAEIHTVTKTTTVPLHLESQNPRHEPAFCPIPATPINREEALAQIRARRGRTQCALKRSASANDANTKSGAVTPVNGTRRIPAMANSERNPGSNSMGLGAGIRVRRDISAPIDSARRSFR